MCDRVCLILTRWSVEGEIEDFPAMMKSARCGKMTRNVAPLSGAVSTSSVAPLATMVPADVAPRAWLFPTVNVPALTVVKPE